jgi:hypothetical protein
VHGRRLVLVSPSHGENRGSGPLGSARKGLPKSELLAKFKILVPSYQEFFDTPVSDSAIWGRADTGLVANDQPLTADDVRKLVSGDEDEVSAPDEPASDSAPVTEQGNDTDTAQQPTVSDAAE